jgi:hypothetical protein
VLGAAVAACSGDNLLLPGRGPVPTTTTIASHIPDPSNQGRGVVFTVVVTSARGTPPGKLVVTASTGEVCNGVTAEGRAECIFDSPGTRTLTASYPGDSDFAASTSAQVTQTVNAVPGATRTIIGTAPDPASVGAPVQLFAHVRGAGDQPAFGQVAFYAGKTTECGQGDVLGTAELNGSGDAELSVRFDAAGEYVLRGCYTGAPGFAVSEDLATETVR